MIDYQEPDITTPINASLLYTNETTPSIEDTLKDQILAFTKNTPENQKTSDYFEDLSLFLDSIQAQIQATPSLSLSSSFKTFFINFLLKILYESPNEDIETSAAKCLSQVSYFFNDLPNFLTPETFFLLLDLSFTDQDACIAIYNIINNLKELPKFVEESIICNTHKFSSMQHKLILFRALSQHKLQFNSYLKIVKFIEKNIHKIAPNDSLLEDVINIIYNFLLSSSGEKIAANFSDNVIGILIEKLFERKFNDILYRTLLKFSNFRVGFYAFIDPFFIQKYNDLDAERDLKLIIEYTMILFIDAKFVPSPECVELLKKVTMEGTFRDKQITLTILALYAEREMDFSAFDLEFGQGLVQLLKETDDLTIISQILTLLPGMIEYYSIEELFGEADLDEIIDYLEGLVIERDNDRDIMEKFYNFKEIMAI